MERDAREHRTIEKIKIKLSFKKQRISNELADALEHKQKAIVI